MKNIQSYNLLIKWEEKIDRNSVKFQVHQNSNDDNNCDYNNNDIDDNCDYKDNNNDNDDNNNNDSNSNNWNTYLYLI